MQHLKDKGFVYHIPDPKNPSTKYGYIGVVKKEKGVYKRFREHYKSRSRMSSIIKKFSIEFKDVKILYEGNLLDCYLEENKLRPMQNIGWNLAAGGGGPYYSSIDNLNEYRSIVQSKRMQNEELKKKQGESFKKNYYNNKESQKLRSKRAKEHMSNPINRDKCLNAMHKKYKCPFCEMETNKGNLTKHIKAKHNEN